MFHIGHQNVLGQPCFKWIQIVQLFFLFWERIKTANVALHFVGMQNLTVKLSQKVIPRKPNSIVLGKCLDESELGIPLQQLCTLSWH